jgi:hypothetical protein
MGQCDELKSSQTKGQTLATLTHIGFKSHVAMGFNGPIVKVKWKGFEEILKDETCFNKMLHTTIKAYVHTFTIKCLLNPILWNYFYNLQVQHETNDCKMKSLTLRRFGYFTHFFNWPNMGP